MCLINSARLPRKKRVDQFSNHLLLPNWLIALNAKVTCLRSLWIHHQLLYHRKVNYHNNKVWSGQMSNNKTYFQCHNASAKIKRVIIISLYALRPWTGLSSAKNTLADPKIIELLRICIIKWVAKKVNKLMRQRSKKTWVAHSQLTLNTSERDNQASNSYVAYLSTCANYQVH